MKNKIQVLLVFFLLAAIMWLAGVGTSQTLTDLFGKQPTIALVSEAQTVPMNEAVTLKATVSNTEFISGPLVAEIGELCVFTLNDPKTRADWTVVRQIDKEPPATFYIDTAGSALTFSSNVAAKYTRGSCSMFVSTV